MLVPALVLVLVLVLVLIRSLEGKAVCCRLALPLVTEDALLSSPPDSTYLTLSPSFS